MKPTKPPAIDDGRTAGKDMQLELMQRRVVLQRQSLLRVLKGKPSVEEVVVAIREYAELFDTANSLKGVTEEPEECSAERGDAEIFDFDAIRAEIYQRLARRARARGI